MKLKFEEKLDEVSFHQAEQLYTIGFNWQCDKAYDKDGNVALAIRFTNGGHNICGECTIDKSRLQLLSDFFNQQNTNSTTTTDQNIWTGVLKNSDTPSKGSLMLVNQEHTIYLRTSRDFSSLVNKQVQVSYKGTLAAFILNDIVIAK